MARYKRSYSGYSSKSGYKRKRYSTDYSRAKGQFKAASRGNDSLSFVVQSNHVFTATYDPQDQSGVAAVNVWDVLNRNSNFSSLKKMYDQVKIDGIKVKLSVTNAIIQLINQNAVNNYTIYTAWDKTGLSPNQVRFYHAVGEGPGARFDEILPGEYDNEAVSAWKTRIGSAIVNNSTAKKSILNNFQRWGSNISCYPSLIYEKGQYVQTGDIKQFCTTPNGNTLISTTTDVYDNRRVIDLLADGNPVVPFESTAVRFKPILLVGVFQNAVDPATGNVTQYGAIQGSVIFNGEWSISCTFRNLKGTLDSEDPNADNPDDDSDDDDPVDVDVTINEFGVHPSPEGVRWNQVTVRPIQASYVEESFNGRLFDLEWLQRWAINHDRPGDFETRDWNIEIPYDPQAILPIPSATIGHYTLGTYRFDNNGLYTMQQLDNDPNGNWIIPAIIQVRVDPPNLQVNQQINNNGVYEIYDEDPNQNNGLEIVPDNPQQQQNQRVLKLREVKTRDGNEDDMEEEDENEEEEEEPSETKTNYLGKFTVNVPQPTITQISNYEISNVGSFNIPIPIGYDAVDSINGTVDLSNKLLNSYTFEPGALPSTFNIEDYNQNHNTDYIGVKSITCSDKQLNFHINIDSFDIKGATGPTYMQSVNANGHYDITTNEYTFAFVWQDSLFYYISLMVSNSSSSTRTITNDSGKKMSVYRFSGTSANRYINIKNDGNIVQTAKVDILNLGTSYNINSTYVTKNYTLNKLYYNSSLIR